MGDMADWIVQNGELDLWGEDPFTTDSNDYIEPPLAKICRYCGTTGLWWKETEKGFRLFNDKNEMHNCNKYKKDK